MNTKELGELRRHLNPEKSAISHIYGCYVNTKKEIISYLDESVGLMPEEECEKYLNLLKKSISGALGKNLIDIVFSNEQVMDSEECKLLAGLRKTELKDEGLRNSFYEKIIASLELEDTNYLILMAYDAYDVPYRFKSGDSLPDASDDVFSYILCCVCPVKAGKTELGYIPDKNEFHSYAGSQIVSAPELGFMYPAFDDRKTNIYNALFYTRNPDEVHHEVIDAIFKVEAPLTAAEQKEAFQGALSESLEDACRFEVIQSVHERLREKIDEHKESKAEEPLDITPAEIGSILEDCGVPEEQVAVFKEKCTENFGGACSLSPENLIDAKSFEVKTPDITVKVDPTQSYLVETRVIDGRKYILVPADGGVEINGFGVSITSEN